MGLFGGTKVSSANSSGSAISGVGDFSPTNDFSFNTPLLDISNHIHIAVVCGLAYVALLSWRKFKK